jgi:subtilase family serine protease
MGQSEASVVRADAAPPVADLVIEAGSVEARTRGSEIAGSFRIKNQGRGKAEPSAARIELDGTALGVVPIPEIAAGEVRTIAFGIPAPLDSIAGRRVRVVVDATGFIDELDETNNAADAIAPFGPR